MKTLFDFAIVARNRFKSTEDYIRFQRFQAEHIISNSSLIKEASQGKIALDLGSRNLSYSSEIAKYAKVVLVCDLNISVDSHDTANIIPIKADATNMPLRDSIIDFCFCSSLIEHIEDQSGLLHEIHRVLTTDGLLYLSFPPFYSPVGGHQFKPFHYLPEKLCLNVCRRMRDIGCDSYANSFGNWGLYPTTIRQVKKLAIEAGFAIERMSTRLLSINLAKVPLANELLTWHVEFLLRKGHSD